MGRSNEKKRSKPKLKYVNKSKADKKPKTKYYRDIKHLQQRQRSKLISSKEKTYKTEPSEDIDEEMVEMDPLQQLMSTFQDKKNIVADSDDESIEGDTTNISEVGLSCTPNLLDEDSIDAVTCDSGESDDELLNDDDPFDHHFILELHSSLLANIKSEPRVSTISKLKWPNLGDLKIEIPIQNSTNDALTILENQEFAPTGKIPQLLSKDLHCVLKVQNNLKFANTTSCSVDAVLNPFQRELFSVISNYQDLFYPERTLENGDQVRFTYCLHAVNHILKTRMKVLQNEELLKSFDKDTASSDQFRDQGLVRPKVLILLPFRNSCYRVVNMIAAILLGEKGIKGSSVINRVRFNEEFTGSEISMPKKYRKPEDFESLFAGNVDDTFRIGLKITKKSLKLYCEFYSADVIIASPLGLRMVIGAEGEKDRDYDFLASIEVLILDQSDVFLMQNWDHVTHILSHLHLQPRESHGTDFSRVRSWALNGWSQYYRQTLLFSSINSPELNALFNRRCFNFCGRVNVLSSVQVGSISRILLPLPHVYKRFECDSILSSSDTRFTFFMEQIWPQFSNLSGVLLYIPSYFDYVRLRNHLRSQDISFVQICEYSKESKVARARDMFFHSEAKFLLYSERFHFFRRINVKGVRHIVFYQPPTYPHFYSELCNMMQENNQNQSLEDGSHFVNMLFCKYDIHQLAAIVGSSRASRLLSSDTSVHLFTTGQKEI